MLMVLVERPKILVGINPFHATGLFLCPLKTSENLWFSDVFRVYRKRPVASNGLMSLLLIADSFNQISCLSKENKQKTLRFSEN